MGVFLEVAHHHHHGGLHMPATCQPVLCHPPEGLLKPLPFAPKVKDKTNAGISCRLQCTCFGPHAFSSHGASQSLEPSSPCHPPLTHASDLVSVIADVFPCLPAVGKTARCKHSHHTTRSLSFYSTFHSCNFVLN